MTVATIYKTEFRQLEIVNYNPTAADRTTPAVVNIGRFLRHQGWVSELIAWFPILATIPGATVSDAYFEIHIAGSHGGPTAAPMKAFAQNVVTWAPGTNYGYYDFGTVALTEQLAQSSAISGTSAGTWVPFGAGNTTLKNWVQSIASNSRVNNGIIFEMNHGYYDWWLTADDVRLVVTYDAPVTEITGNGVWSAAAGIASSVTIKQPYITDAHFDLTAGLSSTAEFKRPYVHDGQFNADFEFDGEASFSRLGEIHFKALRQLIPLVMAGETFLGDLHAEGKALDSVLDDFIDGFKEVFPDTTTELLASWERVFGLSAYLKDLDTRRKNLLFMMRKTGGMSKAYFIGLANALGYNIDITASQSTGTRAGIARAGDTLEGPSLATSNVWIVEVYGVSEAEDLERLFKDISPVNTKPEFYYFP